MVWTMDRTKHPLVTVGMPIRNEEAYIKESLDSVLSQNYPNMEIIISDNASSDSTGRICEQYADSHENIKYVRLAENIGSANNFQSVFEQANGKYFMWAAGHDLWSNNLISECVDILEKDNSAVLAFGTNYWINGKGEVINKLTGWSDTRGLDVFARYFITLWGSMNPVLSIIRTDLLKCVNGFKPIVGVDLVVLSELSLMGSFAHATAAEWYRREFRDEQNYKDKIKRYVDRDYGLTKSIADRYFPLFRLPFYLIRVIIESRLPFINKLILSFTVIFSMPARLLAGYRTNKK